MTGRYRRAPIHADPFYRRGIAEIELGDFAAAVPDLERTVTLDPDYDFHRAKGLLAWAYAQTGQNEKADALFREATRISTISETYYHYACFCSRRAGSPRRAQWAQKILDKKPTMPGYLRGAERPWFRKASGLLGRLKASSAVSTRRHRASLDGQPGAAVPRMADVKSGDGEVQPSIRLLATDIDGTLLNPQFQISEGDLAALRQAHAAGIEIVLVTGRRHTVCLAHRQATGL